MIIHINRERLERIKFGEWEMPELVSASRFIGPDRCEYHLLEGDRDECITCGTREFSLPYEDRSHLEMVKVVYLLDPDIKLTVADAERMFNEPAPPLTPEMKALRERIEAVNDSDLAKLMLEDKLKEVIQAGREKLAKLAN